MNNINLLSQQVEIMYGRLSKLYQSVSISPSLTADLLPMALKELGVASEELQVVMEELTEQSQQLTAARNELEAEHKRYRALFEGVPEGCLVTDAAGTIQEANRATATLLNLQQRFLVGKPLISLIDFDHRPLFREKLAQLSQHDRLELSVRVHRRPADMFDANLIVTTVNAPGEKDPILHWLLRDVTEQKRAEAALTQPDYRPDQDRPLQSYSRGEVIPLEPPNLWLVAQGIVKLTTMSDCGTDMMVGIAAESMVFGSSLTTLQTYQAIALSDAKLACIPLTEIAQSPRLAQAIFPAMKQRLQQTERFLAIYGQIRVEDRLNRLLQLLKQEIGQPVEVGTRLKVRLTHQDFASACCTTRVTITRLLGKLQEQEKIAVDAENRLIIKK